MPPLVTGGAGLCGFLTVVTGAKRLAIGRVKGCATVFKLDDVVGIQTMGRRAAIAAGMLTTPTGVCHHLRAPLLVTRVGVGAVNRLWHRLDSQCVGHAGTKLFGFEFGHEVSRPTTACPYLPTGDQSLTGVLPSRLAGLLGGIRSTVRCARRSN